jgi:tetratricopeptide (TPR) repeat protein
MPAPPDRAKSVFLAALEIPAGDARRAHVVAACGDDEVLRHAVEQLLLHHEAAGAFLEPPAAPADKTVDLSGDAEPTSVPSTAEQPGLVLAGRYRLLEMVGEGGMGRVWTAQQTEPVRRMVAVKLIKAGMDSKAVLARFDAERQALALMDHPNIARVLDAGAAPDGRPFFVMELIKGVPITQFCDDRRLTPRQRLELFIPVCQAIQHAHQKGVIHRDIKPSNVLVALYDEQAIPKVIDFGVAKATGQVLTEQTLHTGLGAVVGTLEYMSPEQASFNNLDIDTRSDVYSLGVLLYELLAGSPPFSRKELEKAGVLEVLRVIREQEPPKPSTKLSTAEGLPALAVNRGTEPRKLCGLLRGELDWIVMKALEKDRARRYETAAAFAADLDRYLADEPVQASPPSAGYRLRKFVRRNRGAVLAAAVVLLVLTGGIIATCVGLVQARAAKEKAWSEAQLKEAERDRAIRAEAEAKTQAEITTSVNRFFQLVLGQADVGRQPRLGGRLEGKRNPNLTVRELLDRAAKRITGRFTGHELVEAAIRHTIGEAYTALGEYPQAQANLERTIELRTEKLGAGHDDTIAARHTLAMLFYAQGKYDQAEKAFGELIAVYTDRLGPDHGNTLAGKNALAEVYQRQGKYGLAEALLREILDQAVGQQAVDPFTTAAVHHGLGKVCEQQKKYDAAEVHAQKAIEGFTAAMGSDHPTTDIARNLLAQVYCKQKRYVRAERLFQEVIARQMATRGPEHTDTLTTRQNLAMLYDDQRKYDQAEPILKEILAIRLVKLPPGHPHTFSTWNNLGRVYFYQSKSAKAIPLYEDLLRARLKTPGDDPPVAEYIAFNLAVNYRNAGRTANAVRVIDEWLPRARARYGPGDHTTRFGVEVAVSVYRLAATPSGRGVSPARAEKFLRELLATQIAERGTDHLDTLDTLQNLASLYWRLKRFTESVPLYEQELEARRKRPADDPVAILTTAFNLAVNYCDAGRVAEATRVIDEWLPRARARLDFDHRIMRFGVLASEYVFHRAGTLDRAEVLLRYQVLFRRAKDGADSSAYAAHLGMLGFNLLRQKKFADAEPVLRECLAIRQKREADLWTTFSVQSILGEVLAGLGKYDEAELLLLASHEGLKQRESKIPKESQFILTDTLGRLVSLYGAWGKQDEAAKWRKDLESRRRIR